MGFAVKGWLVQRRAAGPTVGRTGRLGDLACGDGGQIREAPKAPAGERQLEGASLAQARGLMCFESEVYVQAGLLGFLAVPPHVLPEIRAHFTIDVQPLWSGWRA